MTLQVGDQEVPGTKTVPSTPTKPGPMKPSPDGSIQEPAACGNDGAHPLDGGGERGKGDARRFPPEREPM